MNKTQFLKNILIYFLLILGYVYLYVVNIEILINPESELAPKSKVNFIYQQF
jgi:hypothetical protein